MSYSAPDFNMPNNRTRMCGDCRSSLCLSAAAAVLSQSQNALHSYQGQRKKNLFYKQKENRDQEALAG